MAETRTDQAHVEKLRTYWKCHHAFPSMAKLCEVVGLSSTASVLEVKRPGDGAWKLADFLRQ